MRLRFFVRAEIFLFSNYRHRLWKPHVYSMFSLPYDRSKRVLHRVRSSASAFRFQNLLFCLRSSSSCLRLLFRLLVPSIFPFTTCFRRQFLRNALLKGYWNSTPCTVCPVSSVFTKRLSYPGTSQRGGTCQISGHSM